MCPQAGQLLTEELSDASFLLAFDVGAGAVEGAPQSAVLLVGLGEGSV